MIEFLGHEIEPTEERYEFAKTLWRPDQYGSVTLLSRIFREERREEVLYWESQYYIFRLEGEGLLKRRDIRMRETSPAPKP